MRKIHKRYIYIADQMKRMQAPIPFNFVVDCACRVGDGTKHLVGISKHIIGIDKNSSLINIGKEAYPFLDLRKGSLLSIDIEDDSVDFFVCSETLEHLDQNQIRIAVSEISRVCDNNSYICITVPSNKKVCLRNKNHKTYLSVDDITNLFCNYTVLHSSLFLKNPKNKKRGNNVVILGPANGKIIST
jgi:ubiquinone/menaquinone biosynthesis C-methylase UbiE